MQDGSKPKTFKRWSPLFFVIAAILLLLFTVGASFPTILSSNWGKQRLFHYLKSKYHVDVKCQRLSLAWFGHLEVADLEVIDTQRQATFTCDVIKTEASLYSVLFKKDFGHLSFDKPYLKMSPSLESVCEFRLRRFWGLFRPICDFFCGGSIRNLIQPPQKKLKSRLERTPKSTEAEFADTLLLSFFSDSPHVTFFQRASLIPLSKTSEPLLRFSLPYIGTINSSHGKIELIAEGLDPILFDEIALNLENAPKEHTLYAHLSCLTMEKGKQGKIQADATCTQMNRASPIIKAQADLSQLPVEGIDELLGLFKPRYRGLLVQAIGETADASLNAVSAAGHFEIDLSISSPLFTAQMSMATENDRVSLKKPAPFTYTITPAFFQKLLSLDAKMRALSLKENGTLEISLNQFNSAIPHSLQDLVTSSFDAVLSESSPLLLECNGAPLTLNAMQLHVASTEGSMHYEGQASLMSAQKSGQCQVQGVYDALKQEMSFSATAKNVPTDIIGQISGWTALSTFLGENISIKASGDKNKDTLVRMELQTPLLTLEKAVFTIHDRITLQSPAAFSYQLLPHTLKNSETAKLQGHIHRLSFPLSAGLENVQLDLEASSDQMKIAAQEPLVIQNIVFKTSIHTLSQISLALSSDRVQAALVGKYEEKTGKILFTQPLSFTARVDNALLHAWINTPACLMKPVDFKLSIDPFSFSARAFSSSTLNLKGSASIDGLSLLPFEGSPEITLSTLSIPFQYNGPQKTANAAVSAQVQDKDQSLGSFAFKGSFSDIQWDKLQTASALATLDIQQMPSQFLDAFLGQNLFSSLMGPQFSTNLKLQSTPEQQNMTVNLSSSLLNVKSAFISNANTLALAKGPASIQWTLTPDGYKSLDALLTKQNNRLGFELKEPTRFQITLNKLELPLLSQTQTNLLSRLPNIRFDSQLQCVGDAANPSIAFVDNTSHETLSISSLALSFSKSQNAPLTFACDAHIGSQNSVKNTAPGKTGSLSLQGNIENLFDEKGRMHFDTLSSQISLSIKSFPSRLLDLIARLKGRTDYPFTKVFGNTIQAALQANIKNQSGPVSLNVNSPNLRFSLDSTASKGGLVLNQPIYAQMKISKEMSTLLLKEANPLSLSYFYSEDPITLEIPAKGFYLPLNPFTLSTLAIPSARIELGKIACRNEGNVNIALGLLKTKQFDKNKELLLWFAPMDLHISQGVVNIERTEILLAEAFDIAIWGKLLLLENYVDMVLGLTAQTLYKSFGIKNLPEDYVLTIPMKGKADNVQINSSKATAKIAILLAAQQKALQNPKSPGGALLGGFLQHMATLPDNGKVPPAKHPFPWEKRTSFEENAEKPHEKKLRFKQNEKPLKQLFKVVK